MQRNKKHYLCDGQNDAERFFQHNADIKKVMLLAAVARPKWDSSHNCLLDKKIGFLPLVQQIPAKRSSRNLPAGSLETKTYFVTREKYKELLMASVIPMFLEKFPRINLKKCSCKRKVLLCTVFWKIENYRRLY